MTISSLLGTATLGLLMLPVVSATDEILDGQGPMLMRQHLKAELLRALSRPLPLSREQHAARVEVDRPRLLRSLGLDPEPARGELEARVTGVLQGDGYRLEKLVFESRPGFQVTAHLYVPEAHGSGPYPVIVNAHGHWSHKKSEPEVQRRAIAQALEGYLSLVVDSPGYARETAETAERRWQGAHGDWSLMLCLGGVTGVYVWDLIRALDYLQTRPDADLARVGITGAAGGGLACLYAFAVDDRFRCAVPVGDASSLEFSAHRGCLCYHVPGVLRLGDRADILGLRAPAPVLVMGASQDGEFPPEGIRRTGQRLRALHALYGAPDQARWQVFDSRRGYGQPMREQAMGFFAEHLLGQGDGSPIVEPEIHPREPGSEALRVLDVLPPSARSMRQLGVERLARGGSGSWPQLLALHGGLELPADGDWGGVATMQPVEGGRRSVRIAHSRGPDLPAYLYEPAGSARGLVVLLSEEGKDAAAVEFGIPDLVADGFACLALDVQGIGELDAGQARLRSDFGVSAALLMAQDVCTALAAAQSSMALPAAVLGRGACASQVALFAGWLRPELVFVGGMDTLRDHDRAIRRGVRPAAMQWGADHGASLERLRQELPVDALWHFHGDPSPPLEVLRQILAQRFPS